MLLLRLSFAYWWNRTHFHTLGKFFCLFVFCAVTVECGGFTFLFSALCCFKIMAHCYLWHICKNMQIMENTCGHNGMSHTYIHSYIHKICWTSMVKPLLCFFPPFLLAVDSNKVLFWARWLMITVTYTQTQASGQIVQSFKRLVIKDRSPWCLLVFSLEQTVWLHIWSDMNLMHNVSEDSLQKHRMQQEVYRKKQHCPLAPI